MAIDCIREGVLDSRRNDRASPPCRAGDKCFPISKDTQTRGALSSACAISYGGMGPGLHGGKPALTHAEDLCLSFPSKPETWRGRAGRMKSPPTGLSQYFQSGWSRLRTLSSHQRTRCPPTLPTMACYITCILIIYIYLHAFSEAISLKLYFLNETTASKDSGEFVFQPEQ